MSFKFGQPVEWNDSEGLLHTGFFWCGFGGHVDVICESGDLCHFDASQLRPRTHTPTPPPNTVPVRVPVFLYPDGSWRVPHWDSDFDPKKIFNIPHAWLSGDVPLPEQPAEVEESVE